MTQPVVPPPVAQAEPDQPMVDMHMADGRAFSVPQGQVDAVLASGGKVITKADTAEAEDQAQYGGLAGKLVAGGMAAADMPLYGAAGGLVHLENKGFEALGLDRSERLDQQFSDLSEGAARANPYTHLAGAALGMVPGLFTGSAEASAAKAGASAAEGLAPTIAKEAVGIGEGSALKRVLGLGMRSAAQGAAEGAAFGLGSQISEDALGDHELNAEKLFAAGGKGALFGGAAGGLLGAAGGTLGEIASGAAGGLEGRAARAVDGSASKAAAEDTASLGSEAGGMAPSEAKRGLATSLVDASLEKLAGTQAAGEARDTFLKIAKNDSHIAQFEDFIDNQTSKVKDFDKPLFEAESTLQKAWGEQKVETMARKVDTSLAEAQREQALSLNKAAVETIAAHTGTEGIKSDLRMLKSWSDDFRLIMENGNPAPHEVFGLIDKFKKSVGHLADFGKNIAGTPDQQKAIRGFTDLYNMAQKGLEDASVWGQHAATAQADVNKAYTSALSTRKNFREYFTKEFGSDLGRPLQRLEPGKVRSFLSSSGQVENALKVEAMRDYIQGQRNLIGAMEKHGALDAEQLAGLKQARSHLDEFERTIAQTQAESAKVVAIKRARDAETSMGNGLVASALNSFVAPLHAAEQLGHIREIAERVDAKIQRGLDGFFGGGKSTKPPTPMPTREAENIAHSVSMHAANPSAFLDRSATGMRSVAEHAPKIATAAASTATKAVMFLATKAPRDVAPIDPITPQLHEPRYVKSDIDAFAKYARAVQDPMTVLDDMSRGVISRQGVEALRAVYPKLYNQMQGETLYRLEQMKKPPSYADRLLLGTLLDAPTDAALNPKFIQTMQGVAGAPPSGPGAQPQQGRIQNPQSSGRVGHPIDSKVYQTATERIAAQ